MQNGGYSCIVAALIKYFYSIEKNLSGSLGALQVEALQ